jgi:hypothetical protein
MQIWTISDKNKILPHSECMTSIFFVNLNFERLELKYISSCGLIQKK